MARELKYHSPNTDLTALQRELASAGKSNHHFDDDNDELVDDDEDDDDDADDDRDTWSPTRR
ncbi:phosphopantothenoylcysteine synthetase/decarboxylase [Actinoplanes lutulentus]|nr:phosphopantothenoylcysteine synthetase/decarboxylase [Actinoplanes lutulentus]